MPVRVLVALAAGLALADASIVTLALPQILTDLGTSVEGVAAVLGVYTVVLAAALLPAAWLRRRIGTRALGTAGLALFAAAGILCGTADTLGELLALRGVQAAGGAAALVAAFARLGRGRPWTAAAVFGAAVGPALGGALTQVWDWRAIFLAQAPVAALAALTFLLPERAGGRAASVPAPAPAPAGAPKRTLRTGLALAALSAALAGVLFLLVLLLVSGWSVEPLAAAAAVSVLPLAALAGGRVEGDPWLRASAGCGLVAGGVLALAWLPGASVAWIIAPQLLAGAGMGMGLRALAGELLPERTPGEAARLLSVRHAGIALVLLALAPVVAAELDAAVAQTRERGTALVLDARLPPLDKLALAGPLVADLDPADPRDGLRRALDENAARFADDAGEARAYAELTRRADETLVDGIGGAFRAAFLICGGLALAGAALTLPTGARRRGLALAATAAALALPAAHAVAASRVGPAPVIIADPCRERALPGTGGIGGALQDAALRALDRAACRFGSSREALVLALADPAARRAFEREHGVDPGSAGDLLGGVLGLG